MSTRIARLALVASCLALTAHDSPAKAASIANKDGKDYKLTIIEGSASSSQTVKAGAVLNNVCSKGCVVRIGESANDEYELEGSDAVSIEDGLLYSDGTENPPSARPPAGKP